MLNFPCQVEAFKRNNTTEAEHGGGSIMLCLATIGLIQKVDGIK